MWKDRARRALIAAAKLARQLLREAVDVDDPHWPPFWVYASGALIVGIVLVTVGSQALTSLLSHAGTSAKSSAWGFVIEAPVRTYFQQHSAGLPVSPAELMNLWGFTGLIFFVVSLSGNLGARIGWVIFGLSSSAAVYAKISLRRSGPRPALQHLHGLAFLFLLCRLLVASDFEDELDGEHVKSRKLTGLRI